ncbi:MAG: 1,4-dihydroxy-2-naphthoate octaprenyltransferase [Nitrososphaerota archaeon]|jgi:1,4-dihydroxy-2-naphthoate octaprenyltransferase|nr:1,4-dihydroxy-2-naphthoate octaprenyltransferase [Nitrososphaerota archaeon]MDG6967508.1 1,4-dihydroxy-2-naphthoate octaprenyltransferase [Nitrososphaerota archaeon]MDG6978947.1 1,4-dihydroxy-2-naphthoate octaprenyltransferase [Nitrososphaerota archaeon]
MNAGQLLRLARVPTLAATAVPIIVGGAIAVRVGGFSLLSWMDILAVAFLMQVATNTLNEYGDYVRAVDTAPSPGIAGVIVSGETKPRDVLAVAVACYAAAFLLGTLLVLERGLVLLVLGLAAIAAGVAYSEGPRPVSFTPFGEVLVGALMGPVEVVATTLAASGRVSWPAALFSIPVGLMVTSILLANNLRDVEKDRAAGRRTLAVLIGRARGTGLLLALFLAALLWSVPASLITGSTWVLLVWLALPGAVRTYRTLASGEAWARSVPLAARMHVLVGLLLALSVLLM